MSDSAEIIVAPKLTPWKPAVEDRDNALAIAAMIGKVETSAQNDAAVQAHIALKQVEKIIKTEGKKLRDPHNDWCDRILFIERAHLADVAKEIGRLSNLTTQYAQAQERLKREREEIQRRELERIEREKQAELYRIQREEEARQAEARRIQEEADRKAREAQEAAQRAASEAKNKAQREAARLAQIEADKQAQSAASERERLAKEAEAARQRAAAEFQAAQERAQAATFAESQPITTSRASGQVVKTDWDLQVVNPYELAKFHPDCVKIEPLLGEIKRQLNMGLTIKGVRAEKKLTSNVRAGKMPAAIEV